MIRALARVVDAGPQHVAVEVPGWPGHRPGQFAMLCLDPDGAHLDPLLPRPMAVYRGRGARLEFRFKVVGRGTRLLADLAPGATLGVTGPLGNGFDPVRAPAWLVGGGTGIASLFELASGCGPEARVLLGGRTERDVLGLDDFRGLGVPLALATEDGSLGHAGVVTDLLEPRPGDDVYACGPTAMMRRAWDVAREAGARCFVSLESRMACGIGICLGCAVPTTGPYRYVCTDGPVFDAARLDWDGLP